MLRKAFKTFLVVARNAEEGEKLRAGVGLAREKCLT
jgi:hypothetical protein